jgi:AcrR family transcriptional regulator
MSPRAVRLDPRIQRTRKAIQEAFVTLLSERGLAPLTVGDVTALAGVNRVTFYAHYQGKHDLFIQVIEAHLNEVLSQNVVRPLELNQKGLQTLLQAVCLFMSQVYAQCHAHDDEMEIHIERQVLAQVNGWLTEALARRQPSPNARVMPKETVVSLMSSVVYTAAANWGRYLPQRGTVSLDQYVQQCSIFLIGGTQLSGFLFPDREGVPS